MTAPRIAIGGLFHESNTFSNVRTTREDFAAYQLRAGDELLSLTGTRSEIGGFLDAAAAKNWRAVPVLYAAAVPSGPVADDVYRSLVDDFCRRLKAIRPDAVLLALHGAMVAEGEDEADGAFVERVRAAVGHVPIISVVDFHANVSDRLTSALDGILAYRTYPHVDMYDRALAAADLLEESFRRDARPLVAHRKLPLLTAPQMQYTASNPMVELLVRAGELEAAHDVTLALTPGFPYADLPRAGFSVCATGWRHDDVAAALAEMSSGIEARAGEFVFEALTTGEALDLVGAGVPTPVVLVDSADNVGGGSPGDGTEILREWLDRRMTGLIISIADAEAAPALASAAPGDHVTLEIGGKTDGLHGSPVEIEGRLERLSDGRFTYTGTYNTGYEASMGRTAVLDVRGNTVLVTERKIPPFDAGTILSLGIDPSRCSALVVKSAIAWRAAFGSIAATVLDLDTPGICTGRLSRLPFSDARQRIFCPSERRGG